MVSIKTITKTYKDLTKAIDSFSLEINKGDIYGIIGAKGSGKTTLLKCVAGILSFQEGDIYIDTISIKENPIDCKKIMGYVPEIPNLYENLTGLQFLDFISNFFKISIDDRNKRIEKYAEDFEFMDNLTDYIASYSEAVKQKLSIASALIHSPRTLILDEPFVRLGPKASQTLENYIREISANEGTVLLSAQTLADAEKLCNKIAVIQKGKIIASGDINKIKTDNSLEPIFQELMER